LFYKERKYRRRSSIIGGNNTIEIITENNQTKTFENRGEKT
jgi:hypothetical protein